LKNCRHLDKRIASRAGRQTGASIAQDKDEFHPSEALNALAASDVIQMGCCKTVVVGAKLAEFW